MKPAQSLADFARHIGISPNLAKQWKARGKILVTETGYSLSETAVTPEKVTAVTANIAAETVTESETVTENGYSETAVLVLNAEICHLSAEIDRLSAQLASALVRIEQLEANQVSRGMEPRYTGSAKSLDLSFDWGA